MDTKPTKYYSDKQEKIVAKSLGGYQIGGSGAAPTAPGDVKTYEWLVECKTHTKPDQNIYFDANVWTKICNEATATFRKPVLVVDDGSQKESKMWCLCKASDLNKSNLLVVNFPVAVRKNVTAKHDKLKDSLTLSTKRYIGEFYQGGVFELTWCGEEVNVLPLSLFKEVFNN